MKEPLVSIIILNLNDEKNTIVCLNSILKQDYKNFEVILVDNGSECTSYNAIEYHIKRLGVGKKVKMHLIRLKENIGFAEGNNIGVRLSKSEYIVLLNNDTIVDRNWLKELVMVAEENKNIALVGSEVNSIGSFYKKEKTLGGIMSLFGEPIHIKSKDKSFTFIVSGCSMLFRKSIVKEPFDKEYFAYGEDLALSWLVHLKGYETKMAYRSRLDHIGGAVRRRLSELVEFHGEKNKMMNMFLLYESKTLVKLLPLILLNILITLAASIPKGRLATRLKSYFWLMRNYKKLIEKRMKIQKQRKVSDYEILRNVSCHSPYTNNLIVNKVLESYCFVFRIPVMELRK